MGRRILITLPFAKEKLRKAEAYMKYIIDKDLYNSEDDGYVKINQSILNKDQRRTHIEDKDYIVKNWAPKFMRELLEKRFARISMNDITKEDPFENFLSFTCPGFDFCRVTVIKSLPTEISEHHWERIDIVNQFHNSFKGKEKAVLKILKKIFDMEFSASDWIQECEEKVEVGLEITCIADYEEASDLLAKKMERATLSLFIYFYKSMLMFYNNWNTLEFEEIEKKKNKLYGKLKRKNVGLNKISYFNIENKSLQDLRYNTTIDALMDREETIMQETNMKKYFSSPVKNTKFSQFKNETRFYKKGKIMKKSDGPINYDWTERFIILENSNLMYYAEDDLKTPKRIVFLQGASVEPYEELDLEYGFVLTPADNSKPLYLSGLTEDENEEWFNILKLSCERCKVDFDTMGVEMEDNNWNYGGIASNSLVKDSEVIKKAVKAETMILLGNMNNVRLFGAVDESYEDFKKEKETKESNKEIWDVKKYFDSTKKIIQNGLILVVLLYLTYKFFSYISLISGIYFISTKLKSLKKSEKEEAQNFGNRYLFKSISILDADLSSVLSTVSKITKLEHWNFFFEVKKLKKPLDFNNSGQVRYLSSNSLGGQRIDGKIELCALNRREFYIRFRDRERENLTIKIYLKFERNSQIPGKSISIALISLEGKEIFSHQQAKLEAEYISSSLTLISDVVNKINIDEDLIGGGLASNNPRLEIETFLNPDFNFEVDVKDKGFLKKSGGIPCEPTPFDLTVVSKLKNGEEKSLRKKEFETIKKGYKIYKDGGIECVDIREIKSQEGLVVDLLKTAGKNLFEGKGIVGISLPVKIFEPKSILERVVEMWCAGPVYLKRAALEDDKLERIKNITAFAVSGYWNLCGQRKPFNPILGETYQAHWADGTSICIEHTSHHPPICNYFVEDYDKDYVFYGRHHFKVKFTSANVVQGLQDGPNVVKFKDGDKVEFRYCGGSISGFIFGKRVTFPYGEITVKDEKNDLYAELSVSRKGKDGKINPITGFISKLSDKNEKIDTIEGSWTESIKIGGVKYWDLRYNEYNLGIPSKNALPSDSRFREDSYYLYKRNQAKAQEWKVRLEVKQRKDRKLRKEHNEKNGIKKNH